MISSADEDSSDSLSEPVAKKRDIAEGSCLPANINESRNSKALDVFETTVNAFLYEFGVYACINIDRKVDEIRIHESHHKR